MTVPILVVSLNMLVVGNLAAHPGHENVLSTRQALLRGKAVVRSLVRKGEAINGVTLDESWVQATESADCKETPEYYRISYDNRENGQTLYVLLTVAGKYLRANFDGHFADLAFSSYPVLDCS